MNLQKWASTLILLLLKAPGPDGCPAEYYKALSHDPETMKYIVDIISEFWESGSYPSDPQSMQEPQPSDTSSTPTIEVARTDHLKISFNQINPKNSGTRSRARYERYKAATTFKKLFGPWSDDSRHQT
mmetsp:Transcript_38747/g.50127  ORF Transcript_38747/g.50127 Transcript_38747/m.50127 type:complete len:128 (-) Transcript_38747:64-447(-)